MPKKFGSGGSREDTRGLKAKAQKAASEQKRAVAKAKAKEREVAAEWKEGSDLRAADRAEAQRRKEEEQLRRLQLKKLAAEEDHEAISAIKVRKKPPKLKKKDDPLASLGDLSFMKSDKSKFGTKGKKKKKNKDDGAPTQSPGSRSKPAGRVMTADEELEAAGLARNTNRERAAEAAEGHVDATGVDNALAALTTVDKGHVAGNRGHGRR
eukprot:INCI19132.53.p1 GENE.INCI19132.53~~INCI19132.53.p1  ORF type:complete len:210 (-),score=65.03 INCI19132.53:182-811(-)